MKIKKVIIPTLALSALVAGAIGVKSVGAFGPSENHDTLVQKLAERFNLNQNDVEAVFEEMRTERQAERKAEFTAMLDEAVSNGKLTQEQRDAFLLKVDKKRLRMEEIRKIEDADERKKQMKALGDEMHEWAEANGIDLKELDLGKQKMQNRKDGGKRKHS